MAHGRNVTVKNVRILVIRKDVRLSSYLITCSTEIIEISVHYVVVYGEPNTDF